MVLAAVLSALANVVILGAIPFALYFGYHKWRHGRGLTEVAKRVGLHLGDLKYLGYSAGLALGFIVAVVVWSPPLEPLMREGSSWRQYAGLGLSGSAILMALLYGVIKTGFAEELLFRGLVAGSLARRMSTGLANLAQASVFLLPHLFVLAIAPELWMMLPMIFLGALAFGWIRIKSDSILGPWLIHASVNVAMALSVAARSSGALVAGT